MGNNGYKKQKPVLIRIINWLSEISGYLGGIAIFLATLVIVYQVVIRSLGYSTVWQTELSIYLLMFTTLVGAAYGLKHGSHVGVDIILEKLPPRAKSSLRLVTSFLSMVLTAVVTWNSWKMWGHVTEQGWESSTLWGPPLTYSYFILPLGFTLLTLQYIAILYEETVHFKNVDLKDESSNKSA